MAIAPIPELVAELAAGRMVILVDEEDRENEGDLVLAADHVTPEAINFMAMHARGLICLTLTEEKCRSLNIPLMVNDNRSPLGTNFTVSIEAATGVTTGISAADRSRTVQAAVKKDARASDLVQPGHIFPLQAHDGGVLMRAGHTEAGVRPAISGRSQPASVWPARTSTPPFCAMIGKMWPGCTMSVARAFAATAAFTVRARSAAEIPVVTPSAASIDTVKFVPCDDWL